MVLTKLAEWIGTAGIVLFYPIQNVKLFVTQDPTGLSLPAFVALTVGCAAFAVFGWRIRAWGLLVTNTIGCCFSAAIVAGILVW